MTRRLILLLVAFACMLSTLAGCGTRLVTVTKTIRPCATTVAMNACVQLMTQRWEDELGSDGRAHVACEQKAARTFSCLVLVVYPSGSRCGAILVERLGIGIPYPASQGAQPNAVCDARFKT